MTVTATPAHDTGRLEAELATTSPSASDPATGLCNRQGLSVIGMYLLAACRRMSQPASVLFVRLTNLASIDESFSYGEGDRAVTELADLLKSAFPNADLMGRAAIDSFAVLFTGSDPEEAGRACEHLHARIAERNARCDYELRLRTEGITYGAERYAGVEEMLQEAEDRLDNPRYDDSLEPLIAEAALS